MMLSTIMEPDIGQIRSVFEGLADQSRWVSVSLTGGETGKPTKIPKNPHTGGNASSAAPKTWGTLDQAIGRMREDRLDGVGIVFNGDGLGGFDLDGCRNPDTGEVDQWAQEIIDEARSYAEVSPSGTGVKIFLDGAPLDLPAHQIPVDATDRYGKIPAIEAYEKRRYFMVTGRILPNVPEEIRDGHELGDAWDLMVARLREHSGHGRRADPRAQPEGKGLPHDIGQLLEAIPAECSYHTWLTVLMGVHHADSSEQGFAVVNRWSATGGTKYCGEEELWKKWLGFGKRNGTALTTMGTVRYLAESYGYRGTGSMNRAGGDDWVGRDTHELLFEPGTSRFGRFLETAPRQREWTIQEVLPQGVTSLLAAGGGLGKSQLVLQLGLSVATGVPFLGMRMGDPGSILYLAAEDDEYELHRRSSHLWEHMEALIRTRGGGSGDAAVNEAREAVSERFHVVPRVGKRNLLTRKRPDGEVEETPLVEQVINAASQIPNLKLVVLDPISRYRGGIANAEEDATRFVETLELLRDQTGAGVMGLAHVSQHGLREGGGQEIVRGSTALVDGVRWVATLQGMKKEEAKRLGLQESETSLYLRIAIPKNNYGPPFEPVWIRREAGGVLVPAFPERGVLNQEKARQEEQYREVFAKVKSLLQRQGAMTATKLETRHAGIDGPLGVGQKTVRGVLKSALDRGDLVECAKGSGGGTLLNLPGEEMH